MTEDEAREAALDARWEALQEAKAEDDFRRRVAMNEPKRGDDLACPGCNAKEFTRTDSAVVIEIRATQGVTDPELEEDEILSVDAVEFTCGGCGATWSDEDEFLKALVMHDPDRTSFGISVDLP